MHQGQMSGRTALEQERQKAEGRPTSTWRYANSKAPKLRLRRRAMPPERLRWSAQALEEERKRRGLALDLASAQRELERLKAEANVARDAAEALR